MSKKTTTNQPQQSSQIVAPQQTKSRMRRMFGWLWHKKWWILILIILAISGCVIFGGKKHGVEYSTVNITRGDIRYVVTATGEIQPLNTVSVGSQVSGTIQEIYVDFNSQVKKGQLLLKIEPTVLQASVDEAHATLISAQSQRNYAKSEYERNKTLYDEGFISRAEMEQSQTTYEQAEQSVNRAQSQYDRAETNLGYATIISPVDGTVISRKVDKGQTVAASFQTPDLFEIAEDLSKMQIETAVSEADIGVITTGQPVTFTVDAYPNQNFNGIVRQIRLSPTTTSNVVVYTVIIDVDNSDLRLMPGMTAFVTIVVDEKFDVYKVPNSAFLLKSFENITDNPGNATPQTHMAIQRAGQKGIIFVPYTRGLATATETEIISDEIQPGDKIIVGRIGDKTNNKSPSRPTRRPM